jgi:hypothetical protein
MGTRRIRFAVEQIGCNEASREYTSLWETVIETFPMLTNKQAAQVVSLVVGICHHCYEAPTGCQCWNDE